MDSSGAVGRRRGNSRLNAEDQALDQIAKEVSKFSRLIKLYILLWRITHEIHGKYCYRIIIIFIHA